MGLSGRVKGKGLALRGRGGSAWAIRAVLRRRIVGYAAQFLCIALRPLAALEMESNSSKKG
jgi:hypothetical protein